MRHSHVQRTRQKRAALNRDNGMLLQQRRAAAQRLRERELALDAQVRRARVGGCRGVCHAVVPRANVCERVHSLVPHSSGESGSVSKKWSGCTAGRLKLALPPMPVESPSCQLAEGSPTAPLRVVLQGAQRGLVGFASTSGGIGRRRTSSAASRGEARVSVAMHRWLQLYFRWSAHRQARC